MDTVRHSPLVFSLATVFPLFSVSLFFFGFTTYFVHTYLTSIIITDCFLLLFLTGVFSFPIAAYGRMAGGWMDGWEGLMKYFREV